MTYEGEAQVVYIIVTVDQVYFSGKPCATRARRAAQAIL